MNRVNWTVVIVVGLIVLLVLAMGGGLLGGMMGYGGYHYGGWGMMGPWMMGGAFYMWLIPLILVFLCVGAIVWAVTSLSGGSNRNAVTGVCPNCGKGVQADWKNCPHCGTQLTK